MTTESDFQETQRMNQDATKNLPKDYEKQLRESNLQREFDTAAEFERKLKRQSENRGYHKEPTQRLGETIA